MHSKLNKVSTKRNQRLSLLLRLSPEVRNEIYSMVLTTATAKVVPSQLQQRWVLQAKTPSLTLVCRQIHHESRPSLNTYHTVNITSDQVIPSVPNVLSRYASRFTHVCTLELSHEIALSVLKEYNRSRFDFPAPGCVSRHTELMAVHRALPILETVVVGYSLFITKPDEYEQAALWLCGKPHLRFQWRYGALLSTFHDCLETANGNFRRSLAGES